MQDCGLWAHATQTVFGAGPPGRRSCLSESSRETRRTGRAAVCRTGRPTLGRCARCGRDRPQDVYVTNAVKHFKWKARGKTPHPRHTEQERDRRVHIGYELELAYIAPAHPEPPGGNSRKTLLGPELRGHGNSMEWCRTARSRHHDRDDSTPPLILRQRGQDREAAYATLVSDLLPRPRGRPPVTKRRR